MTPSIAFLLTALALAAVLIARRAVAGTAERSDVAVHLRRLYSLLAALLAVRLVMAVMPTSWLAALLMLPASWLPLAGLRLVEELRRRHAPLAIKVMALGGGILFSIVALTVGLVWSRWAILSLALFQSVMLAAMIVLLATGRQTLAAAERRTADIFLLALLLAIPLVLTDFSALFPDLPVRGGAFAFMVLVLATSRLVSGQADPVQLIRDIVVALAAGAVAGLAADLGGGASAPLAAIGAGTAMLVMLVERFSRFRTREPGLIPSLAATRERDEAALLSSHPLLSSGRVLSADDLAAFPPASLKRLLAHEVVSGDIDDIETREAARELLSDAGATHLLRLSRNPPRLLAIAAGPLAGPSLDDELTLAVRLLENGQ